MGFKVTIGHQDTSSCPPLYRLCSKALEIIMYFLGGLPVTL